MTECIFIDFGIYYQLSGTIYLCGSLCQLSSASVISRKISKFDRLLSNLRQMSTTFII